MGVPEESLGFCGRLIGSCGVLLKEGMKIPQLGVDLDSTCFSSVEPQLPYYHRDSPIFGVIPPALARGASTSSLQPRLLDLRRDTTCF